MCTSIRWDETVGYIHFLLSLSLGYHACRAPTFQSNALQHSKVKLSWDTDDVHRSKVLKRKKLTEDEIKEEDFKAFLASDSEDEPFDDDDNDDNEEKGSCIHIYY